MNRRFSILIISLATSVSFLSLGQEYPVAMPTDQPGIVLSPFSADRELDVAGMEPGSLAMDPIAKEVFRIPYSSPVQQGYEDYLGNPQAGTGGSSGKTDPPSVTEQEARDRPALAPRTSEIPVPPHRYPEPGSALPATVKPSWTPDREVLPEDLLLFLFDFNHLSSNNDPAALLPFYADPVGNYFGKARVNHKAIYKDREAYIRRFPQRSYLISSQPVLLSRSGNIYDLMLRVDYAVSGSGKNLSGSVTHSIQVQEQAGQYRITRIEESKAQLPPREILQEEDRRRLSEAPPTEQGQPGLYDWFQQEQLERFLEAFTASGEVNDPAAGVAFMHPRMDVYYSLRKPSHRDLLNDRSRYIQRWPERRYWLTERPRIRRLQDGTWEAVSRVGYEVRNQSKYLSGVATSVLRMAYTTEGLKIVSIRED